MSTESGTPALSKAEWIGVTNPDADEGEGVVLGGGHPQLGYFLSVTPHPEKLEINVHGPTEWWLPPKERHALAALCLYQQPFGFTQEDVAMLRWTALAWEKGLEWCPEGYTKDNPVDRMIDDRTRADVAKMRALADRISNLLPPAP